MLHLFATDRPPVSLDDLPPSDFRHLGTNERTESGFSLRAECDVSFVDGIDRRLDNGRCTRRPVDFQRGSAPFDPTRDEIVGKLADVVYMQM